MGVGGGDLLGMARLGACGDERVLRGEGRGAGGEIVKRGDEFAGPDRGVGGQCRGGVGLIERQGAGAHDIAGVHAGVDAEDAHPARRLPRDEGALDRGGPAVGGQEREVEVEPAESRRRQRCGSGDRAVGDDGDGIGADLPQLPDDVPAQTIGFDDGQSELERPGLDG